MRRFAVSLLTLTASICASPGCDGDEAKTGAASTAIEIQPTDSLRCGFGVTPEKGPWDEITLQADGSIKWTHVGPAATRRPDESFAKSGQLDAAATRAWMQEAYDLGLPKRAREDLGPDAERIECRGALGGQPVDFRSEGPPDPPLRAQLDALTARCITGG